LKLLNNKPKPAENRQAFYRACLRKQTVSGGLFAQKLPNAKSSYAGTPLKASQRKG